jgi:hypothetical protein
MQFRPFADKGLDLRPRRYDIHRMRPTAAERRAQHFAEFKQQREREDQARRDQVIAEFNGDPAGDGG